MSVTKIAVTLPEAAELLGMTRGTFERHVRPHIRLIRAGRTVRVPVSELERWAREHQA